jgi:hypothetical protein
MYNSGLIIKKNDALIKCIFQSGIGGAPRDLFQPLFASQKTTQYGNRFETRKNITQTDALNLSN